jgi:hypothetical protein
VERNLPEASVHSMRKRVEKVSSPRTLEKTFGAGEAAVAAATALSAGTCRRSPSICSRPIASKTTTDFLMTA